MSRADDITKTAASFAWRWTQHQQDSQRLAMLFEQAILAERERCAKIAEQFDGDGTRTNYGRSIASAIRKG